MSSLAPTIVRDTLGLRLLRLSEKGKIWNTIDAGANAALATVTASNSANGSLTRSYSILSSPASFLLRGGRTYSAYGGYRVYAATCPAGNGGNVFPGLEGFSAAVEFYTDALSVDLSFRPIGSSYARVLINDQYVSTTATALASTNSLTYVNLAFSGRTTRKVRVEFNGDCSYVGAAVTTQEAIWAPDDYAPKVSWFADSIGAGKGPSIVNDACLLQAGKLLGGWDIWQQSFPGSGYITPGNYTKMIDHIGDLSLASFDIVVFLASMNDNSLDPASVTAAALACLRAARALLPKAVFIVFGGFGGATVPLSTVSATENNMSAAVAQFADPNTFFIPMATDVSPWLYGSGYPGHTDGTGNNDWYMSTDGWHPSDLGSAYVGRRMAAAIRRIVLPNVR